MKLENQVCSLEQSEKLNKLGANQDTSIFAYCWVSDGHSERHIELLPTIFDLKLPDLATTFEVAAYTVAELGEMLIIGDDDHFCDGTYNEHLGLWQMDLRKRNDENTDSGFDLITVEEDETEAECRAAMLIYLLENKIIILPS